MPGTASARCAAPAGAGPRRGRVRGGEEGASPSGPPADCRAVTRSTTELASVQRRTLAVLSGGVALGGLGVTVGITVGGLLARDVAGTETAAGLGQTAGVLGAAVLAVPLARIKIGRASCRERV